MYMKWDPDHLLLIIEKLYCLPIFWFQMGLKIFNRFFEMFILGLWWSGPIIIKKVIFHLTCKHYGTLILEEEIKPRFDLLALTTFWNQKKSVHTWVPSTKSDQPILVLPYCLLTSVCPQSTEAETLSTQLPTQLGQWIILFTFPSS